MSHVVFRGAMKPYRVLKKHRPVNWGLCLMLAGAIFLTLATLVYKWGTP